MRSTTSPPQSHVQKSPLRSQSTQPTPDALGVLRLLEAIRILGLEEEDEVLPGIDLRALRPGTADSRRLRRRAVLPALSYAVAKLYGYWDRGEPIARPTAYMPAMVSFSTTEVSAATGAETFVTRKITLAALRESRWACKDKLYLGNLGAKRDWGHARRLRRDAVARAATATSTRLRGIATGEQHSVRDFVKQCAAILDLKLTWEEQWPRRKGRRCQG